MRATPAETELTVILVLDGIYYVPHHLYADVFAGPGGLCYAGYELRKRGALESAMLLWPRRPSWSYETWQAQNL